MTEVKGLDGLPGSSSNADAATTAQAPSLVISEVKLSEDEYEVLLSLDRGRDSTEWLRPMDAGGTDGSHHSRTLAKLFKRGLVERRDRGSLMGRRAVWLYRCNQAGREARWANTLLPV